jgi:oligo-alginate lyase
VVSATALLLLAVYDVGPFAKPSPEREFAELKHLDAAGSPLRKAREDWAGARKRAAEPEWAAWLRARRAEVDDWMAKRRDRVEWVAGWWHDFVSPKDGSFLTWTPDEPGEDTLSSPSDPRVKLTPKLHGGWVFGFRSRHTEKVLEAARLGRLTGERKYSEWAASQLDFYAENWAKWPIQKSKSKARLMHQSLDDANVLVRLVNAARLLEAPAERRRQWIDALFRPQAELLEETMQSIHNIACWQRSAVAQTAIYANDDALWKRAVEGPYGIRKQVEHGITSEYLWFEQSLLYNNYVVSALLPLFTMASLEGRAAELTAEMHAAENMMLAPTYLRFPTGQLPNPADATTGLKTAPNAAFLASAYRVFPTALGLMTAAASKSWDTLLDPPEAVRTVPPLPQVVARDWKTSRVAVLRGGPWQVFVHYGQLHRSHAQAEALNFEAFYESTDVTHDPGTVGYGSPLHRGFYQAGFAHNVVLFDREGQERWQPGEVVLFEPGRLIARQPRYRADASVERDLRIDGSRLIDVVTAEGASKTVGLVLHLQGRIEVPRQAESAESLPYWKNARAARFADKAAFEVRFGSRTMRLTVEVPGPFTAHFAQSPDVPPDLRDSLYIEAPGNKARFVTTLEPVGR